MGVEKAIQIAVAKADIIICLIAKHLPCAALSLTVGLVVGTYVYRRLQKPS